MLAVVVAQAYRGPFEGLLWFLFLVPIIGFIAAAPLLLKWLGGTNESEQQQSADVSAPDPE